MKFGALDMHVLYNGTCIELDRLARLVKEGKALDQAAEFARYLQNSRLADLLDAHRSDGPLPCDGRVVRKKADALRKAVQLRWEFRDYKPHVETSDLEQIRAELAELRASVQGKRVPILRVVKGGK